MTLRTRPWLIAGAVMALLFGLTSGTLLSETSAQEEPIELLVWDGTTDPVESANIDEIYAAFTEERPNVTVVREVFGSGQLRETVNTALGAGQGPDVFSYDAGPGFAGVLADAGFLVPVETYAEQFGWTERVAPWAIAATTINDQWYGMPNQTDLIGVYYNKTLLDQEGLELPQTVDELIAFCGAAKEKGYFPFGFADNPGWQAGWQYSMTSAQMMGPEAQRALLFDHEGSWNTPESVVAIETFFVTLRDADCFPEDAVAIVGEDGDALFFTGQALLHSTGNWLVSEIETQMPDYEVGFMPFPEIEGGHGRVWVTGVGSAWFISANSEHSDVAAEFIDHLISQESAEKLVEVARWTVPFEVDLTNVEVSPLQRQILEELQSAGEEGVQFGYNIDVLAPPEFNEMMTSGFQSMLTGDKTAEQQAADLQAAWEEGLAEE